MIDWLYQNWHHYFNQPGPIRTNRDHTYAAKIIIGKQSVTIIMLLNALNFTFGDTFGDPPWPYLCSQDYHLMKNHDHNYAAKQPSVDPPTIYPWPYFHSFITFLLFIIYFLLKKINNNNNNKVTEGTDSTEGYIINLNKNLKNKK